MSIALLKKSSSKTLEQLKAAAETKSSSSYQPDSRFWKPVLDKETGTGYAVVRFLPAPQGEDLPFAKVFSYNFKTANGYYSEKSLVSIGESDPYAEFAKRLWETNIQENQDVCRKRKRQTKHYVNVLVVNDKQNPDNNGKVFLYEAGVQIFQKILDKLNPPEPEFEDEVKPDPIDVFHAFEGADFTFRLVAKEIVGYNGKTISVPDYEKSSFGAESELLGGDEDKIMSVWERCHSLAQFTDKTSFKTYEQLQTRMVEVLGSEVGGVSVVAGVSAPKAEQAPVVRKATAAPAKPESFDEDMPEGFGDVVAEAEVEKPVVEKVKTKKAAPVVDEDDDFLNSLLGD